MFIRVTNRGGETLKGPAVKFDGKSYEFPPGVPVTISVDAARHIFGIGQADKTDTFTRHGWMAKSTDYDDAMNKFGMFKFDSPDDPLETQEEKVEAPAVETEQRSAPLQAETVGEPENAGADEPVIPEEPTAPSQAEVTEEKPAAKSGSMLDNLMNFVTGAR